MHGTFACSGTRHNLLANLPGVPLYVTGWYASIGRMDHEIEDERAAVKAEREKGGNEKVIHTGPCATSVTQF